MGKHSTKSMSSKGLWLACLISDSCCDEFVIYFKHSTYVGLSQSFFIIILSYYSTQMTLVIIRVWCCRTHKATPR